MGKYEDMANDAGYAYGSDENQQMAENLERQDYERGMEEYYYQDLELDCWERRCEILFRKFTIADNKPLNSERGKALRDIEQKRRKEFQRFLDSQR